MSNAIAQYQRRLVVWALGQFVGWVSTSEVVAAAQRAAREAGVEHYWLFGLKLSRAAETLRQFHEEGGCGRRIENSDARSWLATSMSGDMPLPAPVVRPAPAANVPKPRISSEEPEDRELRIARRGRELAHEAAFGREAAEIVAKLHRHIVDARSKPESAPQLLETMQTEIETLAGQWRKRVAA